MKNTKRLPVYPLNAKAIKKALKGEGIKVECCKKCYGSQKGAAYIATSVVNLEKTVWTLNNMGIVDGSGHSIKLGTTNYDWYDFGACYMSEEMYKELNTRT